MDWFSTGFSSHDIVEAWVVAITFQPSSSESILMLGFPMYVNSMMNLKSGSNVDANNANSYVVLFSSCQLECDKICCEFLR